MVVNLGGQRIVKASDVSRLSCFFSFLFFYFFFARSINPPKMQITSLTHIPGDARDASDGLGRRIGPPVGVGPPAPLGLGGCQGCSGGSESWREAGDEDGAIAAVERRSHGC